MVQVDSLPPTNRVRTPFVEFWGNRSPESALILDWMRTNRLPFQLIDVPPDLEAGMDMELPAAKIVINGIKGAHSTGVKAIMEEVMGPLLRIHQSEISRQIDELSAGESVS